MKILYHHRTGSRDGQSVHIEELIAALKRRGHDIRIVAPRAVRESAFGDDSGFVATLKKSIPAWVYELMEFGYGFYAFFRLWRHTRAFKPDCIYERYNLFLPASAWLKRVCNVPVIVEVNAPLAAERERFDGLSLRRLARWTENTVWRHADAVLPVTEVLAGHVRAAGVAPERIHVIPNGIDPEKMRRTMPLAEAKAHLSVEADIVLGFIGFIRDWHGLDRVIGFLADDPAGANCHFLVAGTGPEEEPLKKLARTRGVADRVTFLGLVPRDEIPAVVSSFDIALQPAVVAYASPLKLFEYLALGCAVVAPATANIREVLTDGENAVLFDPDDPADFRRALGRLCGDPVLRRAIAEGAEATISRRGLTWDANAARVESIATSFRT